MAASTRPWRARSHEPGEGHQPEPERGKQHRGQRPGQRAVREHPDERAQSLPRPAAGAIAVGKAACPCLGGILAAAGSCAVLTVPRVWVIVIRASASEARLGLRRPRYSA